MHSSSFGRVRGVLAVAILVALAACGESGASSNGAAGGGAVAATPTGVPRIGDPRAALPSPAAAPAGDRIAAATSLAEQVRGGGERGAAALLTALRLSGIGVRGANGEMIVDPVRPYQGTIINAWEIRPLVALARRERTVLIPLEELALLVRTVAPPTRDVAIEAQLIDGIRHHATDSASALNFWANFVAALGDDDAAFGAPAPGTAGEEERVVLNGLQASLLMRRLATDILVRANPPQASSPLLAPLRWLAPRPLYAAASPAQCQLTETGQTIMDLTAFGSGAVVGGVKVGDLGFGGLMEAIFGEGTKAADRASLTGKVAAAFLGYAQFIMTYLAVDAEITLDQPPLPRTREPGPQTGETRNLVAVITMNTGDEQAVNCFRMMFNSVGLDFSLPQGGPAKGAMVAWRGIEGFDQAAEALHRGPEAIVQFVDDPANRIQNSASPQTSRNAIINQKADDNGTVRITVEGRGQKKPLPRDVGRVAKQATVGIQVALKGADLFGDVKDAASAGMAGAAGLVTLPLDLLYRMKWFSAAQLTFPVLDWGAGKGWSGTVDVVLRTAGAGDEPMVPGSTYKETRATRIRFDFTNGVGAWSGSESRWRFEETIVPSRYCSLVRRFNAREKLQGSGAAILEVGDEAPGDDERPPEDGDNPLAFVSISYDAERTAIGVGGLRLEGLQTGTETSCVGTERVDGEAGRSYFPLGSTYGTMPDPMKATELNGSASWPYEDEGAGTKGIIMMTWKLHRTR